MGVTDGEPQRWAAAPASSLGRVAQERAQALAGAVRSVDLAGQPDQGEARAAVPRSQPGASAATSAPVRAAAATAVDEPPADLAMDLADPLGLGPRPAASAELGEETEQGRRSRPQPPASTGPGASTAEPDGPPDERPTAVTPTADADSAAEGTTVRKTSPASTSGAGAASQPARPGPQRPTWYRGRDHEPPRPPSEDPTGGSEPRSAAPARTAAPTGSAVPAGTAVPAGMGAPAGTAVSEEDTPGPVQAPGSRVGEAPGSAAGPASPTARAAAPDQAVEPRPQPKSPVGHPSASPSRPSSAPPGESSPGEPMPWTPSFAGSGRAEEPSVARSRSPRPSVAPPTERSPAGRPAPDRPTPDRPAHDRPAHDRPAHDRPAPRRPAGHRVGGAEPAGEAARTGRSAPGQQHHQHRRPEPGGAAASGRGVPAGGDRAEHAENDARDGSPNAGSAGGGRRFRARAVAVIALGAGLIGGLVGGACVAWLGPDGSGPGGSGLGGSGLIVSRTVPVGGPGSVADVAAKVLPSVVTVQVDGRDDSTGSGVIIRSDGYILTSAHLITSAAAGGKILVTRDQDVTKIPARLVGVDLKSDLAVLHIDAGQVPAATLGQSGAARIGDPVIAIGAPLGLSGSVTTGVVSGLDRRQTEPLAAGETVTLIGAIQTDAAINPGSSGGPLVDALGQVIGVNTAIGTVPGAPSGQNGSIGVGFAIPIDDARAIAEELIQTGHATHPYLGFSADTITSAAAKASGRVPGALITILDPGGPAATAGLAVGDIVTKIGDQPITTANQLLDAARSHHVGDRLTLTYLRAGRLATAQMSLAEQN